jgi:hypothetical protein
MQSLWDSDGRRNFAVAVNRGGADWIQRCERINLSAKLEKGDSALMDAGVHVYHV